MILALLGLPVSAPSVISLNDGWEFIRLASAPSVWNGADSVSTSQWKVVDVSSQETAGEVAPASQAFDGNPKTIWHSKWQGSPAQFPHELIIDLGSTVMVEGFRLLPRVTSPQNGRPNHIQVFLSQNVGSWGNPVVADSVPDASTLYQKAFAAVEAKYLRLVVLDGHRKNEPFLAVSEIGLIRSLTAKQRKDWASQYHIASVETGDARFDLKGKGLEELKRSELESVKGKRWEPATLPHAAWVRPLDKPAIWQGVSYYRRKLRLDAKELSKHLELEFDGAMQVSDLWLNGKHVANRRGGYLPLVANLTGKVRTENEILVRVDNQDNPLVPPGKPQSDLDFMYGSGIHREARLRISNGIRFVSPIAGLGRIGSVIASTSMVKDGTANQLISLTIQNDSGRTKKVGIKTKIGLSQRIWALEIPPGSPSQMRLGLQIPNAKLWSPANPFLYDMEVSVSENGVLQDRITQKIGIRTVSVSRQKGFVLNGKPLELIGTNRHQDYPWVGPALSKAANYRDAKLIRDSGHNIVRLSHYPQSEEFLDACDKFGVMVIPCIAGWQFINRDNRFEDRVEGDIRELVIRDLRHPCVAWFEPSLNETYPSNEIAKRWSDVAKHNAYDIPVLTAGDAKPGAPWDIAYNQWRDEDMSRPQTAMPGRPGYVREYGDYEFGGGQSTSRVRIRDGMSRLLGETWNHVWSLNHLKPQLPWTMGLGTWEMFDHNVPWDFSVSASGLADIMRREKPSYWFYKSQIAVKPYSRIAADWQAGSPKRTVVVFTNQASATLIVNGKTIATERPVRGEATSYPSAKPFDGTNTGRLVHPPIIFRNVPYIPGELRVVAGTASDAVSTAGAATSIRVWVDDLGVKAEANDLIFVRAAVVDAKGTICPSETRRIRLNVRGAKLAGEEEVATEAGIASFLVRTPMSSGSIDLRATASGLASGIAIFRI